MKNAALSEILRALRAPPPRSGFEDHLRQALLAEAREIESRAVVRPRAARLPARNPARRAARRWGGRLGLSLAVTLGASAAAAAAGWYGGGRGDGPTTATCQPVANAAHETATAAERAADERERDGRSIARAAAYGAGLRSRRGIAGAAKS